MLSTVRWINSSGGDWDTAANWSTGALPAPGDDVVVDVAGITITHASDSIDLIHSLDSRAALSISGGTLAITSSSKVDDLTLSFGTLTGTGDVTVAKTLNWTGGTMSGSGTTIVPAGGAFNLAGILYLNGGRTLDNSGTATWSLVSQYDSLATSGGATIDNRAGATFTVSGGSLTQGDNRPVTINNAGTFVKKGSGESLLRWV